MSELETAPDFGTLRVGEVMRRAMRALASAGVETPRLDAQRLLAAAMGRPDASLIAHPEAAVSPSMQRCYDALVARRCAREPVSRIVGEREFYGRPFSIGPATLDPRADSETVIEEALAIAAARAGRERPLRILDIGTGSGALLVTLLAELPLASGLGTDVSAAALEVAAGNARRHGVEARARFEPRDGLSGVDGPFELVVCNPPYVGTDDIAGLAPEVREHDPHGALDGGPDGLAVYRKVIPQLARVAPAGAVVLEVAAGLAHAVAEMLRQTTRGGTVRTRRDLGGHDRCVSMEIQL